MSEINQTQSKFLLGLTGTLWPLHIKPKPGELFSSWLIRFAHIHGYRSETICTLLFGYRSAIWNRDIDKLCPKEVLAKMRSVTGATYQQTYSTFLYSYKNYLSLDFNKEGNSRWIIPLGVHHRTRTRPSLMYCPLCLVQDSVPFYRKLWRIAWATVCTDHGVRLIDACPYCGSFVMPHRSDQLVKNSIPCANAFLKCCNCGRAISNAKPSLADESVVRLQRKLEFALQNGYIKWGNNSNLYSFLLFEGIRELTLHIMREIFSKENYKSLKREIEFLDLEKRYEVMKQAAFLLDHWPYYFQGYIEGAGSSYCYLKNYDFSYVPFWYYEEIKKTTKMYSKLSGEEVSAIQKFAKKSTGYESTRMGRAISGRDIAKFLKKSNI
jgi:hypothetical protein